MWGPPQASTATAPPIWMRSAQETMGCAALICFRLSSIFCNPLTEEGGAKGKKDHTNKGKERGDKAGNSLPGKWVSYRTDPLQPPQSGHSYERKEMTKERKKHEQRGRSHRMKHRKRPNEGESAHSSPDQRAETASARTHAKPF